MGVVMKLIIGGREQGKLNFALNKYGLDSEDVCDCAVCCTEELSEARCVYRLHEYVRRVVYGETETDTDSESGALDNLTRIFRDDAVIICDEVGLGIVPADAAERAYREAVGRLCCRLAAGSESVERVYCGIGVLIK